MNPALIRLAYRQIIDATAQTEFERNVFADSLNEFQLQIQTYNQATLYTTWQQIRAVNPQAAISLPVKVGFAIGLYVRELKAEIPGLTDTLGQAIAFADYLFALLDSDVTDKNKHRVALIYQTAPLTLLSTPGNYLLLALGDQRANTSPVDTFMVEMRTNLSITSWQTS